MRGTSIYLSTTPLPLSTPHSHRPKRAACSRQQGVPLHAQARQLAQHGLRSRIGVLKGQCLDRRIRKLPTKLVAEIDVSAVLSEETKAALEIETGCSPPTRPEPTKWRMVSPIDPSLKSRHLWAARNGTAMREQIRLESNQQGPEARR